jgi:hypothetical protein
MFQAVSYAVRELEVENIAGETFTLRLSEKGCAFWTERKKRVADFQGYLNRCQNIFMNIVAPAVSLAMTVGVCVPSPQAARPEIRVLRRAIVQRIADGEVLRGSLRWCASWSRTH